MLAVGLPISSTNAVSLFFSVSIKCFLLIPFLLRWSSQTHIFYLLIHLNSFLSFLIFCSMLPFIKPLPLSHKSSHCPDPYFPQNTPYSHLVHHVAMPVCPRSVSCHPMGSMSFKALQAQPLPHCRSQERSLSRDTASSSSTAARRRTSGTKSVGHVINPPLWVD